MMIASIQKQEVDLLHNLQQTRKEELRPLLNKLEMIESDMTNFHCLKVCQLFYIYIHDQESKLNASIWYIPFLTNTVPQHLSEMINYDVVLGLYIG